METSTLVSDLHGIDVHLSQAYHSLSSSSPTLGDSVKPFHSLNPTPASQQNKQHRHRPLCILAIIFRSVVRKVAVIANLITCTKPDIVAGLKTWINSNIGDCEFFPSNYKLISSDRNGEGGVLIAVSDDLACSEVLEFTTDCKVVWARIKIHGQ